MKKIILVLAVIWLLLFVTGFSWGGFESCKGYVDGAGCGGIASNRINYFPRPAYTVHGQLACWMLPFERYWTDDIPLYLVSPSGVWSTYTVAYSLRCNQNFRWYLAIGIF